MFIMYRCPVNVISLHAANVFCDFGWPEAKFSTTMHYVPLSVLVTSRHVVNASAT